MRLINYYSMANALNEHRIRAFELYTYLFLLFAFTVITLIPTILSTIPYRPIWLGMLDKIGATVFILVLVGGAWYINSLGDKKAFLARLAAFNVIAFLLTTALFFGLMLLLQFFPNALPITDALSYRDLIFKYSFIPLHLYIVFAGMRYVSTLSHGKIDIV